MVRSADQRPTGRPAPGQSTFFLTEPTVQKIAEGKKVSPAQVVLSWAVQRGTVVIPKSENIERMKANITVRVFCLPYPWLQNYSQLVPFSS